MFEGNKSSYYSNGAEGTEEPELTGVAKAVENCLCVVIGCALTLLVVCGVVNECVDISDNSRIVKF